MYKPYRKPVVTVSPDVKVSEPKISKLIILLVKILSRVYLYVLFGFAKIILREDKILFDAFNRVLSGESRCLIAFRHPDGREPQLLAWFFLFRLKALAAKKRIKFPIRPHAIFIYGYEVARWGGPFARFFMPNIGAIPIHHTKVDSKGMARIYKAITDGPYPVALAPEGQVSYTIDSVPRLESGTIRIGLQAAAQLAEKNINCPVEILPLSIFFRYGSSGKRAMEKLLKKTEKFCNLSQPKPELGFHERLKRCRDYILELNENRYKIKTDASLSYEDRLEQVINSALGTAERLLDIKSEGDYFQRLYKVRHVCWDRIYLPGIEALDNMTNVERSIKDLEAGEAWHIARHQELADFAWYFRCPVPADDTSLHTRLEYVQNLWDFANRTMGGAIANRVNILPQKVILQASLPINLSSRLSSYKEDKKGTINLLVSELENAYLKCIKDVNANIRG
jgi:hypothetical protein